MVLALQGGRVGRSDRRSSLRGAVLGTSQNQSEDGERWSEHGQAQKSSIDFGRWSPRTGEAVHLSATRSWVELIGATTSRTGLSVRAELDRGSYPKGIKISDDQLAAAAVEKHDFHGVGVKDGTIFDVEPANRS